MRQISQTVLCMLLAIVSGSGLLAAEDKPKEAPKPTQAELDAVAAIKKAGGSVMQVAQNDNRLEVAFHLADGKIGDDQVATVLFSVLLEGIKVIARHLVHKGRQCGFRQHNQFRLRRFDHVQIGIQRSRALVCAPFHGLRNIALQQGNTDRSATRRTPWQPLEGIAANPDADNDCCQALLAKTRQSNRRHLRNTANDRRGTQRKQPRNTEHADDWRKSGKRAAEQPTGRLRVADDKPGKP